MIETKKVMPWTHSVQCAAVRTYLLLMMEPPQKCRPRCTDTWYGAKVMSNASPPIIRPSSRGFGIGSFRSSLAANTTLKSEFKESSTVNRLRRHSPETEYRWSSAVAIRTSNRMGNAQKRAIFPPKSSLQSATKSSASLFAVHDTNDRIGKWNRTDHFIVIKRAIYI